MDGGDGRDAAGDEGSMGRGAREERDGGGAGGREGDRGGRAQEDEVEREGAREAPGRWLGIDCAPYLHPYFSGQSGALEPSRALDPVA